MRLCAIGSVRLGAPVVCPLWAVYKGLRMLMLASVGKADLRAFKGPLSVFFRISVGMVHA